MNLSFLGSSPGAHTPVLRVGFFVFFAAVTPSTATSSALNSLLADV
jgi:hypothetical protein